MALGRDDTAACQRHRFESESSPGRFKQNLQAKEASDAFVRSFYKRLDGELAQREYMADNAYSIADITGLATIG